MLEISIINSIALPPSSFNFVESEPKNEARRDKEGGGNTKTIIFQIALEHIQTNWRETTHPLQLKYTLNSNTHTHKHKHTIHDCRTKHFKMASRHMGNCERVQFLFWVEYCSFYIFPFYFPRLFFIKLIESKCENVFTYNAKNGSLLINMMYLKVERGNKKRV